MHNKMQWTLNTIKARKSCRTFALNPFNQIRENLATHGYYRIQNLEKKLQKENEQKNYRRKRKAKAKAKN